MGHGPAKLDKQGVHGASPYVSRVIRNQRWKAWVNTDGEIDRLYDMKNDPSEKENLLAVKTDGRTEAFLALQELRQVVASMPKKDARPRYSPRAANPWDKKPTGGKRKGKKK
jgi:hypothetical protein